VRAFTFLALLALLGALTLAPAPAPAQDAAVPADAAPVEAALAPDTWLGGLAAVGCGIFVRASIVTAGTQVGTIAGAVACCAYAVIDLVFIDPH
jgi:hypothetical protein